jgi:hypothetical protein
MKALTTRVGTYITGDAVADAVLTYSLALARLQQLDLVDIPVRNGDGRVARVQFRLGWMVDMDSVSKGGPPDAELLDAAVIADLREREIALHPRGDSRFAADEMPEIVGGLDEY